MNITLTVEAVEKNTFGSGYTVTLRAAMPNVITLRIDTRNPQSFPIGSTYDMTLNIREES